MKSWKGFLKKGLLGPKYTIPTIEEKLLSLTKAKVFTIVDVSEAFHTILLHEKSSLLTAFQGPKGCYSYNRMPFGDVSGPEEYQRRQHEFLEGLRGVINIADDICVYGYGDTKTLTLTTTETWCSSWIILLNTIHGSLRKKNQFKSPSVTFMGNKLTHGGVEPDPAKVANIREMPFPTDKAAVQRFLGMCQYLSKFCHNLSETVLRCAIRPTPPSDTSSRRIWLCHRWGFKRGTLSVSLSAPSATQKETMIKSRESVLRSYPRWINGITTCMANMTSQSTQTTNRWRQSLRNPWAEPPVDCKQWCWSCRNTSSLFVIRKEKRFLWQRHCLPHPLAFMMS